MFVHQQGKDLSLLDFCGDLFVQHGIQITKQSIQERFNEQSVAFMESVLARLLSHQFNAIAKDEKLSGFNRVRVKDSTRFSLPKAYAPIYRGPGGARQKSKSMVSIQYEYDLLSGDAMDLRLTTGIRNDQLDSKENTHDIAKNDLLIRDLGYATLGYLLQIIEREAYFLNRLSPKTTVYYASNPQKEVSFTKCHKLIKKHNLPYLEYKVLIGKTAQIPSRLIIYPVDQATYDKRISKTRRHAKSKGLQVSDAFKVRSKLSLFITNAGKDKLPTRNIKKVYGLRWQIELTFKIWKSQASVHRVKNMKIQRFQCQLIAKLIWLLIHMRIFKYLTEWVNNSYSGKSASIWKYYKHAFRINNLIRKIITIPYKLKLLLQHLTDTGSHLLFLETKKGKTSHYETLISLN